jgi:MFS transporter, CP family, cyanate transporter
LPTNPVPDHRHGRAAWQLLALLALTTFQLRSVIVGVAPVLPELRSDLHLSFSATGALTAIPVLGLGAAAVPGALLVNRFGARRVVGLAVLLLGAAGLLRLSPPLPYSLFLWTAALSLAVAVAQPAITVLIRDWFPGHIQQASNIYAMALGLGGLAGASLGVYLLAFGGWRGTFVIWSALALLAALLWIVRAPGRGRPHAAEPAGLLRLAREWQVWHVALLFGSQSLAYYGGATWIPFLVRGRGPGFLALVLFLFQAVSPPLSLALSALRAPWALSRLWYAAGGILLTAGNAALMLGSIDLAWLWAAVISLGTGMIFNGTIALPALLAHRRRDVAGYTGLVLTAGYAFAFVGPLLGGFLLDRTHQVGSPFWVLTAAGVVAVLLGLTLPRGAAATRAPSARPGGSSR